MLEREASRWPTAVGTAVEGTVFFVVKRFIVTIYIIYVCDVIFFCICVYEVIFVGTTIDGAMYFTISFGASREARIRGDIGQ